MTWEEIDWRILERLRDGFLHGGAAAGPYWQSHDDLAHYDFTFGERIGWKWDAVLGELRRRGWQPPAGRLLDWGCGSGIAGRRVGAAWPGQVRELVVWDHSALARSFAAERARGVLPGVPVSAAEDPAPEGCDLLVISHVLNELDPAGRGALAELIERAQAVLWVEPGTSDVARQLVEWREKLRGRFRFLYPCPHDGACGLLAPGNERHWCHHFAPPPSGIFADSGWVRFGQRAGIDLRSLPFSALVAERLARVSPVALPEGVGRVIGRPEAFKPYVRLLDCSREGVREVTLPKRADPRLYRRLDRADAPRLWHWQRDGATLRGGSPLPPDDDPPADH